MKITTIFVYMTVAALAVLALAGCKCTSTCDSGDKGAAEIRKLDIVELTEMMTTPGKVVLVDARKWRTGMEYIPGSVNLYDESTDTEIANVLPNKDAGIVTYCANIRCTASPKLAERLKKLGYTNVMEFPVGIAGWKAAGEAVETAK